MEGSGAAFKGSWGGGHSSSGGDCARVCACVFCAKINRTARIMCEECKGDTLLLGKCARDERDMLVGLQTN